MPEESQNVVQPNIDSVSPDVAPSAYQPHPQQVQQQPQFQTQPQPQNTQPPATPSPRYATISHSFTPISNPVATNPTTTPNNPMAPAVNAERVINPISPISDIIPPTNPMPVASPAPVATNIFSQPTPDTANTFQQPSPGVQPRKSLLKNKAFVVGIAAAIILFTGGGSALAYNVYQSPQKVLSDAIINAITAKSSIYEGVFTAKSEGSEIEVLTTAKQIAKASSMDIKVDATLSDKKYAVNAGGMIDNNGDLYFMVGGLAKIVNDNKATVGLAAGSAIDVAVDNLVKKVDGVWVKVSSEELQDFSEDASTAKTCSNDAIEKFKNDESSKTEVTNVYRKNPFVGIGKELGQKNGNFGYEIKYDTAAYIAFLNDFKQTKIYKELNECDDSFEIDTSDMTADEETEDTEETSGGSIALWVNAWSHQIAEITASNDSSDESELSASIKPTYGTTFEIKAPTKSISLNELKTYFNELSDAYTKDYNERMEKYNSEYDNEYGTKPSASLDIASIIDSANNLVRNNNGDYASILSKFTESGVPSLMSGVKLLDATDLNILPTKK